MLLAGWALGPLAEAAWTQSEAAGALSREIRAVRLDRAGGQAIRLDGLLDEPAWLLAQPATAFHQREPLEGAPATEDTEVRVLYDAHALYVGVAARDGEPQSVIGRVLQRDRIMELDFEGRPRFAGDDGVAILLDPFHDHRNAVVFATNPNGAEFDALVTDEGREVNVSWRGVWAVAARRTSDGWSAEFAIPFRTLRYPGGDGGQPWGFNVYRVIRRKNEEALWTAWSRANEGFARISRAGHIVGLDQLPRPGLNVELKPFTLAGGTEDVGDGGGAATTGTLDAGLDLKYEVRPGLVLDATFNTDFAQVEVDDEQVNLTRFSLFLPEKRDFFLENAGVFEFGVRSVFEPPPFLLFFSRRVGIAEDGAVPILGGARLTGRVGRQTVGFLDVLTDEALGEPRTNFAVLRVKRDVGASHYVGAMVTDRRDEAGANTAGGVDWSFWPGRALNVQGFAARTETSGPGGDGNAFRVGLDYQTGRFGVNAHHVIIGPEATAEMGFITRTDIRRTSGFARITARPRALGLRRLDFYSSGDHLTRVHGRLQDWGFGLAISPEWNSGENITVYHLRGFTRLDEGFDLADSVPVVAADYDLWQLGWFARTSPARPVALNAEGLVQGIFGGRLTSVGGGMSVAAGSHLSVAIRYAHNTADLPGGAFTADLAQVRLGYAFSTRLVANALLQYNSLERAVSANVRVNFLHRPGSDLFIVLNEERGTERSAWAFASRGVRLKVTYLARL